MVPGYAVNVAVNLATFLLSGFAGLCFFVFCCLLQPGGL